MTVFISCVGTRDPIWSSDRSYNPEVEGCQEIGCDLNAYNAEYGKKYQAGPLISFFRALLEEQGEIFDEAVCVYLFGTKKMSPLFELDLSFLDSLEKASASYSDMPNIWLEKFRCDDLPLSENARISIEEEGDEWLITDEDQPMYIIKKESGHLGVYEIRASGEEMSKKMTYKRGERVAGFLQECILKDCPNCKIYCLPLYVTNPADSKELYQQIRKNSGRIKAEMNTVETVRYIINPQPGTPQMSYVFIALSVAGFFKPEPDFLEYILPENRGTDESSILVDNVSMISQRAILKRAQSFFRRGYFLSAADAFADLRDRMYDDAAKRKVEVFVQLSDGYAKWDIRQYREAKSIIDELLNDSKIDQFNGLREILNSQRNYLGRSIEGQSLNRGIKRRAVDWHYDARRRFDQAAYSDVVWRCAQIDEIIAVAIAKIAVSRASQELRKEVKNWLSIRKSKLSRLSRVEAYIAIRKCKSSTKVVYLDSPLGNYAGKVYELRNKILHEGYTANKEEAANALNVAERIVRKVYGDASLANFIFDESVTIDIADNIIPSLVV